MWYFRDYVCGLYLKLQKQENRLKCQERQFVNLFLCISDGKASVLGSAENKGGILCMVCG